VEPDGKPRPALRALAGRLDLRLSRLAASLEEAIGLTRDRQRTVEVLAADVTVRLSDVDTAYPHWAKPYGGAPARAWEGTFYLDRPPDGSLLLRLETMQVEERANFVYVNGHRLPDALPVTGRTPFASVWTSASLPVPAQLLQPGANRLRVELSPRPRTQQDIRYESIQLRNVRLTRP